MTRRRLALFALAAALLLVGRFVSTRRSAREPHDETSSPSSEGEVRITDAGRPALRRPPSAVATIAVVTPRTPEEAADAVDRAKVAARMTSALCGDEAACAAAQGAWRDEHATSVRVVPVAAWSEASAFAEADRKRFAKAASVIVVRVATPASNDAVALRAAFASAGAIAGSVDGLVADALLGRVETAEAFAAHAVTEPLHASTFRPDRVKLVTTARDESSVRIVTAGLSRWGAPDVEAAAVPNDASAAVGAIVLAVARALADGAEAGPVALPPRLDARTNDAGATASIDAGAGDGASGSAGGDASASWIAVDLVSGQGEANDPNDFMARIEPPDGEGPMAYLALAERFFGPVLSSPASEAGRPGAEGALASALAGWTPGAPGAARVLARFPFVIPGDAGTESLWIDVTRFDARTITGKIAGDPLAATDVARGDVVTRDRKDVEAVRVRPEAR